MMRRTLVVIAVVMWMMAAPVSGSARADWARRLFETTRHDFGVVARAAKTEYAFKFTNTLDADVHIASVYSSCGCTSPRVVKRTVKSGETGYIIARFNTRSFQGQRGATVTVVFDRPWYAEVQLDVRGYIRRDVVFDPGKVDFGSVDQGQGAERTVRLEYAGWDDWRIVDVRSPWPYLSVEAKETHRGGGRVGYRLIAHLAEDAPAGYLNAELTVLTSDRRMKRVPLTVTGQIRPALAVNPGLLFLGNVTAGSRCQKRVVVRAHQPFRITKVECDDPRFRFEVSDEAKRLHFISVFFQADDAPGEVARKIRVFTDLDGGRQAELTATATVVFPVTAVDRN